MHEAHTGSTRGKRGTLFMVVAAAAVIAWAILIYVYVRNFGMDLSHQHSIWGEFGEYVGGTLGPILGTLTLFGVLYTVILQQDVLIETTRAERNQRVLNQQQMFESAFFEMLAAINR